MNKLIEQLETLPAFNSFRVAVEEQLSLDGKTDPIDNAYLKMEHIKTDCNQLFLSDKEEDAMYKEQLYCIERLLDNDDLLDEFVTEQIREETIELVKALIKEIVR